MDNLSGLERVFLKQNSELEEAEIEIKMHILEYGQGMKMRKKLQPIKFYTRKDRLRTEKRSTRGL